MAPGGEGFVAMVSIDKARIASGTVDALRQDCWCWRSRLLLGISAAWWVGGRVIVRPAEEIVGAGQAAGGRRARCPHPDAGPDAARRVRAHRRRLQPDGRIAAAAPAGPRLPNSGRSRSAYAVLDLVLNSMQDALVAVNAAGQFLMFNKAAARLFPAAGPAGHAAAVAAGSMACTSPDGSTHFLPEELPTARALRGESGRHLQMLVRNAQVPAGRLLQCSYQPVRGEGGISGGLVVFTDVTALQRLQDEQALQFRQLRDTQLKLIEAQRVGHHTTHRGGGGGGGGGGGDGVEGFTLSDKKITETTTR
jgi:PAS domain-containing protein